MSTLAGRSGSAVLIIDLQVGVVDGAFERDAVIAAAGRLVERARSAGVPVLWVQHDDDHLVRGTDAWRLVPELVPGPGEPLVEKSFGDAFEATTLEDELAALGVARLVVAGAATDACIRPDKPSGDPGALRGTASPACRGGRRRRTPGGARRRRNGQI